MKYRSRKGLLQAAVLIRRDMDKTPPLIPVDKGNLRASWYMIPIEVPGKGFGIRIGFSADYALAVHEVETPKQWKRPGAGPKFFESSIQRNHGAIMIIIQQETKRS